MRQCAAAAKGTRLSPFCVSRSFPCRFPTAPRAVLSRLALRRFYRLGPGRCFSPRPGPDDGTFCPIRPARRLCNGSLLFRRSWLANRLKRPRWRRASRGQIARKPQLLRKFLLLDSGGRLFRNLVRNRGHWLRFFSGSRFRMALRRGSLTHGPLSFVDKTPDGSHQMRHGNVDTPLPKNLRDPVDAEPATMRLQDLFLVLSQGVDLGLLSITSAFRPTRDLTGRFVLVLVVVESSNPGTRSDGVLECGVLRQSGIAPA
jgi:hypothetical protein